MFKNLKSLKISSRKKQEDNSHPKKNKWTKPKVPGLKKFKETMGNLTPSMFHGQHYIENVEEHATQIMYELQRMRTHGTLCDMTINKCGGGKMKAHKIVVTFNEKLYQLTLEAPEVADQQTSNEVAEDLNNGSSDSGIPASPILSDDEVDLENLRNATSETDLVKQLSADDVIREEVTSSDAIHDETEQKSHENTGPNESEEPSLLLDVTKEDDVTNSDESKVEENSVQSSSGDNQKDDDIKVEDDDVISPPLVQELNTPSSNSPAESDVEKEVEKINNDVTGSKSPQSCDVTIEEDDLMAITESLEDPLEVLINFFYTSHINITKTNVTKLRIVAQQCDIVDVTMACDEFENVLRTETENMATNEEKDGTAAQFRYQYSDPQMPIKLLEHFEKLRSHSRHIDSNVTSSLTSSKFPGHEALLVASSAYFAKDQVPENASPNDDVITEVQLPDMSDAVIQSMVTYMYTARISVTSHNVRNLMEGASILGLSDLIEGGAEYLEGTIGVQNCIDLQKIAEKYGCDKLKNHIIRFIISNFMAVSRSKDFLTISKEWLLDIVTSHHIVTEYPAGDGEFAVFESVKRWLNHDLENRKEDLVQVMEGVRFQLLTEKTLVDNVSTDLMIMENGELCEKISQIIIGKSGCNYADDVTMRGEEFILMIGGSAPVVDETSDEQGYTAVAFNNFCTLFNVPTQRLNELTYLPETKSLHCALSIDQYVFVAGGFDKFSCITNEMICLDLTTLSWTKLPDMKTKRACFAMFSLGGYIYVAGGLTPTGYTNKVERYNRLKKKWDYMTPLPKTYYRHAGCVYNEELIISGGNEKFRDVLSYSPSGGNWRMMKPLNYGRDSHVMVNASGKIYAIGGDSPNLPVEVYDSSTEYWQVLHGISNVYGDRLYLPGAAVFGDKIYLIGGWKGDDDAHDDIKCFDTTNEVWLNHTTVMPFPRGSLTACTVRLPKNYISKTIQQPQQK